MEGSFYLYSHGPELLSVKKPENLVQTLLLSVDPSEIFKMICTADQFLLSNSDF